MAQDGGKKKRRRKKKDYDDDDSDSDSDDDLYDDVSLHKVLNYYHPINRFWYYPYLYTLPKLKIKAVTMPTFVTPLVPKVMVYTNPVYWKESLKISYPAPITF